MNKDMVMDIAEAIIEAMHLEAKWSKRPLPVPSWEERSPAWRESIATVIEKHLASETLPSPEQQHNLWMDEHLKMGWKYGKERDLVNKTHPNLVPYSDLPEHEKQKDALFLALVALVKMLIKKGAINVEADNDPKQ
jgi:hypothetical protein